GDLGNERRELCLTIRGSRPDNKLVSSLTAGILVRRLKESAGELRCSLLLDCCFSASAIRSFQSPDSAQQVIVEKVVAAVEADQVAPRRGISLFCSSSASDPSNSAPGRKHTM